MPISFAPVIDEQTEILVIGTMPGVASLEAQEYYAFKHNAFWRIISDCAGVSLSENYTHKLQMVKRMRIGLWDNLQFCEREGSLDSDIHDEIPNDFETLLKQYPAVKKLLFNGQKSYQFFKRYHPKLLESYNYAVLPSTSPANAKTGYADKLKIWRKELLINVSGG